MLPGVGGFRVTRVTDKELLTQNQHYAMMHSVSAMQENQHKSVEEIRYEAYAKAGEPAPPGTSPGAFGQPTSGGTPFGTPVAGSGFGGGASPSAGVFGAPSSTSPLGGTTGGSFAPASSSPFGALNTAFGAPPGAGTPFGAATSSAAGAFGAAHQGGGAFGAVPAGAGIFGGSSSTASAFGNQHGTSSFGGAATSTSFGGSSAAAGNGPFGGSSPSTGAFGGATPASPFSATSTPVFGGGVATPGFGSTSPVSSFVSATGAFGTPASTPAFGGAGGFGSAASTPAFGAPTSSPAFGVVAAALGSPAQASGFGAGAGASSASFGAPVSTTSFGTAPATPSLSTTPGAANMFGASTAASANAFGASTSAAGGTLGFGATTSTAPAGSFFGSAALAATTSSGFGASPASSPPFGGLSSTPTTTPGNFGGLGGQLAGAGPSLTPTVSSTPAFSFVPASSALSGGGTFGAAAQPVPTPSLGAAAPSSLFGGVPAMVSAPVTSASLFGAPVTTGANEGVSLGYGSKNLGLGLGCTGGVSQGEGVSTASQSVNAAPYGISLTIPPPATSPATVTTLPLKKSLLGSASPNALQVSFPVRTLTPRSPWLTSRGGISPRMKPRGKSASPSSGEDLVNGSELETSRRGGGGTHTQFTTASKWMFKPRENPRKLFIRPETADPSSSASLVVLDKTMSRSNTSIVSLSGSKHLTAAQKTGRTPESRHVHFKDEVAAEENVLFTGNISDTTSREVMMAGKESSCVSLPTITTRDGYSMEPSQEVLRLLSEEKGEGALANVEDFIVSRQNFGSIKWLEPVDIRGLEIDRVVRIECGVIYVYPESSGVVSPPAGEGLKKRAEVTLYECRPKKTGEAVRAKFEERVLKQTRRMGGDLLEYNVDTGVWRFALQL